MPSARNWKNRFERKLSESPGSAGLLHFGTEKVQLENNGKKHPYFLPKKSRTVNGKNVVAEGVSCQPY
jgi:hypothetical protein